MRGILGRFGGVMSLLLWPMTPTKLVKLVCLAFIFAANFGAWGDMIGNFIADFIPIPFIGGLIGGGLGRIVAIVAFTMCQWSEIEPELNSLGCEEPEANLRKAKLASENSMYAGLLRQDMQDELVHTSPLEIARARGPQAIAFGLDMVISGTAWYPFQADFWTLIFAPMGLLDFNIFNVFMLLLTVFGTPRILISAMKDGRIKSAKQVTV